MEFSADAKANDKPKRVKIGEHEGLAYYTIGQRQGVRVGAGGPWFVARKDLETNTLVVTNNPHDKLLETVARSYVVSRF